MNRLYPQGMAERQLNRTNLALNLVMARDHVDDASQAAADESDEYCHIDVEITCSSAMWYFGRAWHERWLSNAELHALSDADDDLVCESIPNFCGAFRLNAMLEGSFEPEDESLSCYFNHKRAAQLLGEATQRLDAIAEQIKHGSDDQRDERDLEIALHNALRKMSLAWNARYFTDEAYRSLPAEQIEMMATSIPDWGCMFRLVDAERSIFAGREDESG